MLYELSQQIGFELRDDELLGLTLQHAQRVVPYDAAAVLLLLGDDYTIYIRSARELSTHSERQLVNCLIANYGYVSGRALDADRARVTYLHQAPMDADKATVPVLGSVFQVPLVFSRRLRPNEATLGAMEQGPASQIPLGRAEKREVVGLLVVAAEEIGAFSEDQMRLVYTMANQTASALQRMRALLAAQQERLESLVETSRGPVADGDFRPLVVNPAARHYLVALGASQMSVVSASAGTGHHPARPMATSLTSWSRRGCRDATRCRRVHYSMMTRTVASIASSVAGCSSSATSRRNDPSRRGCSSRRAWRPWGNSRPALHTTLTISSRRSSATPSLPRPILIFPTHSETIWTSSPGKDGVPPISCARSSTFRASRSAGNRRSISPPLCARRSSCCSARCRSLWPSFSRQAAMRTIPCAPTSRRCSRRLPTWRSMPVMPCQRGGTLSFGLLFYLGADEEPPVPWMPPGHWVRLTVTDTGVGIPIR